MISFSNSTVLLTILAARFTLYCVFYTPFFTHPDRVSPQSPSWLGRTVRTSSISNFIHPSPLYCLHVVAMLQETSRPAWTAADGQPHTQSVHPRAPPAASGGRLSSPATPPVYSRIKYLAAPTVLPLFLCLIYSDQRNRDAGSISTPHAFRSKDRGPHRASEYHTYTPTNAEVITATLQAPSKFPSPDAPTIFITLIHHRPVAVSFRAPPLYRYIPSNCILKLLLFCRLFSVVPVPTFETEIPARYRCRTRFDPRTGARIELQNTTSAHRPTLRSSQQHFKRRANSPAQLHQLYSSRLHSVRRHEHHTTLGMAQPNQRNQRTLHLLIHHQPVAVSFRAPPLYRYIPSHCILQLLLFCRLFSVIPVLIFETEMPAPYRCRPLSTQGPGSAPSSRTPQPSSNTSSAEQILQPWCTSHAHHAFHHQPVAVCSRAPPLHR